MRKISIVILIIAPAMFAYSADYVDLVGTDSALYVAWGEHLKVWETSTEITFESSCFPTLGIATLNGVEVLLYTRCHYDEPDTLYILDQTNLDIIASREILPEQLALLSYPPDADMDLRLARYQPEEEVFYLGADPTIPCSGNMEYNAVLARLNYTPTEGIVISDTLGHGGTGYVGFYYGLTGPVFCGESLPMIFWAYYGSYTFSALSHMAGIFIIDGDPVQGNYEPMLTGYIYSATGSFSPGNIKCSGASDDEVVVLWTNENDSELFYSVYDCTGVVELIEEPMVLNSPGPGDYMTLSRNPSDDGMLLVWVEAAEIRCSYRDGAWSPWEYTIESLSEEPLPGSVRVCSVSEGYWVSWWISGEPVPELRFVPREDVVSIQEEHGQVVSAPRVFPNPCNSAASISFDGVENTGSVYIYDLEGRLIDNLEVNANSTIIWNTENVSQGTYLLRMGRENAMKVVKVAVIH